MKDIKTIIDGYELTDEQKAEIIKAVNENYKTVEEVNKKSKRIDELENANKELTEQIEAMPDGEEVEKLKSQVEKFKADEKQRKADEAEAAKRQSFEELFNTALEGKEFVNQFTRDSIFEKAYERCAADTGLSAEKAIEELTQGDAMLFKNPQQDVNKMPSKQIIDQSKANDENMTKKKFAAKLFSPKE